jgi:hypothetical protein
MKVLLFLYPPWWRRRHSDEARAIVEHTSTSLSGVHDILRGALDAWVNQKDPARSPLGDAFGRFTDRARRAMDFAQEESRASRSDFLGTEHLLLGVIAEQEGVAAKALASLGISPERVRSRVTEAIGAGGSPPQRYLGVTRRAKQSLQLSVYEADQLGHDYLGTEHLLLGLIGEGEGIAAKVLAELGVDQDRVREHVLHLLTEQ